MIQTERFLAEIVAKLPQGDPERAKLETWLQEARAYNANKTETTPLEIVRFTPEAKQALEKEGLVVYELIGQSIKSLREAGRAFWSTWHQDYPEFEARTSRLSEVAINPDPKKFFLPKSNNKTLDQQLKDVADFSKKLSSKVRGVEAVLGEVPDYAELAFTHLDKTGERLFGEKYNYDYTRTVTRVGSIAATLGLFFHAANGPCVNLWPPAHRRGSPWAAPLVVPVGN